MNKELEEILYGHLKDEQRKLLFQKRDIRYADIAFYQTIMLEEAFEKLGNIGQSKPDMMLMSPKQYEAMKRAFVSISKNIDKKKKKK